MTNWWSGPSTVSPPLHDCFSTIMVMSFVGLYHTLICQVDFQYMFKRNKCLRPADVYQNLAEGYGEKSLDIIIQEVEWFRSN